MGSRPLLIAFPLAVAALLGACSVKNAHTVNVSREAPTEIGRNDRVTVILASYVECENSKSPDCDAPKESASVEYSFENCIDTAISARNPSLGFVHAREVREKVFPGTKFADSPRSEQNLLAALADPATRNKMEVLGLHYILVLHVATRDGDGNWGMAGSGGKDGGVIAFAQNWERRSDYRAMVVFHF